MKCLYELTLNKRTNLISRVEELCSLDESLTGRSINDELQGSMIHLIASIILGSLRKIGSGKEEGSINKSLLEVTGHVKADLVYSFLLGGADNKLLIPMLKHFRSSIRDIIFEAQLDKLELYECLSDIEKYFDVLELALYEHWEANLNKDALLYQVFEQSSIGIVIQEEKRITYINETASSILGYQKEEASNKNFCEIIHADYHDLFNDCLPGSIVPEDQKSTCKLINKLGTECWIDLSVGNIELAGRNLTIYHMSVNQDRKKLEELRQQSCESIKMLNEYIENDKIRTEFFSNFSHEFRTPLNVILGTLQLVDMYTDVKPDLMIEKTKKYHKLMRQNCYRLLRLVNNLVDLTKLDAGYMNMNMGNYDIVRIVSQIAASVADYIENKGINFVYRSMADARTIACDPDKIERIILNLLSNAIKFTDCGGTIFVNVWDAENKIFISVKDNGVGIPKEKQDNLFKRFVQIEKSLSRNHNGSGIGLSLVKSLVELHGGKISLLSEAGKGSEFIIELPIKQMAVMDAPSMEPSYSSNNKIEVINIEFSDIYSL